jgi:hypothetical protein
MNACLFMIAKRGVLSKKNFRERKIRVKIKAGRKIKKARVIRPGPLGCEGEPQLVARAGLVRAP